MTKLSGVILKASDFTVNESGVYLNNCDGNPGMLLIHGNFCNHCHRFYPTFNEIAESIGTSFCCASIESEELKNSDLSTALDFQGFPTIKFFDQTGKIIGEYKKERNKESVLNEICQVYHHCIEKH